VEPQRAPSAGFGRGLDSSREEPEAAPTPAPESLAHDEDDGYDAPQGAVPVEEEPVEEQRVEEQPVQEEPAEESSGGGFGAGIF